MQQTEESDKDIRERIMLLFALREDQVEPEWITWAKEHSDEFGDWTFEGDDHQASLLEEEYDIQVTDDELAQFEHAVGEGTAEIIPLSDFKELEEGIEVIDMTGAADQDDTSWIEDAEVRAIKDYEEPANGEEAAEAEAQTTSDTVPDSELGDRMRQEALDRDIQELSQAVAQNNITTEKAVETVCKRHDITAEGATDALGQLLEG